MVKIEEKSLERRAQETELDDMLIITAKNLEEKMKVQKTGSTTFSIVINNGIRDINIPIVVYLPRVGGEVYVYDQEHFNLAYKLAELYEERTKREFTIKKEY